ncbi:MAG: hypothetical protein V1875_00460 [Candidatus Altiarchaeota archaeon]
MPLMSSANYIQIVPKLSPPEDIQDPYFEIPITITNRGDESAYETKFSLILPDGFTGQSIFYQKLEPKQEKKDIFRINISEDAIPGAYIVALLTNYKDENQYPFSSVNAQTIIYKTPTMNTISGIMGNLELEKEAATTNLKIMNRDEKAHDVKIKLILPDELRADIVMLNIVLEPNKEQQIPITIEPAGALPGSIYPITAIASYTENNQHYASLIRGVITIKQTTTSKLPFPVWLPPAILVSILGYLIYRKITKNRKKKKR